MPHARCDENVDCVEKPQLVWRHPGRLRHRTGIDLDLGHDPDRRSQISEIRQLVQFTTFTPSPQRLPDYYSCLMRGGMGDAFANMNAWGGSLPPRKEDLPPVPPAEPERERERERIPTNGNESNGRPDMQRAPRSYGVPGPRLIDPSMTAAERGQPAAPFIRVRLGSMDRNKKDLLIRFDLSVSLELSSTTTQLVS